MKIDIGNGKVLGTKRVSPNGQISGFTEYAGQEVLVVLPGSDTDVKLGAKDLVREVQIATNEHMKVAFHQYKELKQRFETPERATKEFLQKHAPKNFQGLFEQVEGWVKEQVDKAEEKIEVRLHRGEQNERASARTEPAAGRTEGAKPTSTSTE
ncbi:MAG TPA: hypothetical protein VFH78_02485 [Candidatus Thermoplasmatota archaeon]|nr:hypothetical protein [Candidatus Thermoplasmatota archaeon]